MTHGDWLDFIDDGVYRDPRWWLAAGWDWLRQHGVEAPLYWQHGASGSWTRFTLHGRVPIDPHTPVPHLSYFEADAYARWRAARNRLPLRLPTEAEWVHAVEQHEVATRADGNFLESGALHPMPMSRSGSGSCATPASHVRRSYRNFFPTAARWQFSGLRLACDG